MAKRKRPITSAEVPTDLLDAVHRVPWESAYLAVDEISGWQTRFASLRAHDAYTKACAEAVAAVSDRLKAIDWTTAPAAFLAGCVEGNLLAQRGVDRFLPLVGEPDQRTRRAWYAGWWMLRAWERGVPPEPILSLIVIAFEGGPPALAETWRRCAPPGRRAGSFAAGMVRFLAEAKDEPMLTAILATLRERGRRWVPKDLGLPRHDVNAEFDAATWEVLHERIGTLTPVPRGVPSGGVGGRGGDGGRA